MVAEIVGKSGFADSPRLIENGDRFAHFLVEIFFRFRACTGAECQDNTLVKKLKLVAGKFQIFLNILPEKKRARRC